MGFKRFATAHWEGDLKSGKGAMSTPQSGLFAEQRYSFNTRFGEEKGTNPEELLAAAHAGCFSMALSAILGEAGFEPKSVRTTAEVSIEKVDGGFAITKSELRTEADIPDIDEATFQEKANAAKLGCPVSKVLAGANITLEAKLV